MFIYSIESDRKHQMGEKRLDGHQTHSQFAMHEP